MHVCLSLAEANSSYLASLNAICHISAVHLRPIETLESVGHCIDGTDSDTLFIFPSARGAHLSLTALVNIPQQLGV